MCWQERFYILAAFVDYIVSISDADQQLIYVSYL